MSEAKDWAGELISGQTGTGRILVCFNNFNIQYVFLLYTQRVTMTYGLQYL